MIAMAIGAFLSLGAVQVYVDCRKAFDVYQTSARLQETARYAMSVIEPDIRLANYWGYLKGGGLLAGATAQTAAANAGLGGASVVTCGNNFSVDLATFMQGSNDTYNLACAAFNNRPVLSADTLTVRRASTTPSAVAAGTAGPLRVCTTRVAGSSSTSPTAAPSHPPVRSPT